MAIKLFLSILVWIGLPSLFYAYMALSANPVPIKNTGLLLMYMSFSWCIAVLIFVLETARRGLFGLNPPLHSSLRLGVYGGIAMIIVIIAIPKPDMFQATDYMTMVIVAMLYGHIMGYIYQGVVNKLN